MKNAKKLFAVLVVLALALSMVVPAAAAEKTAKINISNATAGQTYTIYKMADLVDYNWYTVGNLALIIIGLILHITLNKKLEY